jgi:hypothetical protein
MLELLSCWKSVNQRPRLSFPMPIRLWFPWRISGGIQNVVLYFLPKDDTPGCAMQAIDFSELPDDFAELDTL